jgi:O-antigen/teichoic acid export membrane protein
VKSPLKALSQETAIYGLSTVVGRFLNFLLVPFYVNVLRSRAEYGFAASLYAYLAFLSVVFPLGLEGAYFRYAARAEGKPAESDRERRLFSSPFWLIASFALAGAAAIAALAPQLVGPAFSDPSGAVAGLRPTLVEILRSGAVILLFDALAVIPFAALRLEHRAWAFALVKVGNIVGALALNLLFLLRFRWGVAGIFRANAIVSAATFLVLLPLVGDKVGLAWDRGVLKKMLPFGLATVPAYLGAMMVQVIDRPIVQHLRGFAELGVYQANYRMGFAMMIFVSIFDYAWRPFFLRQYATQGEEARPLFARVFTYTTLFLSLAFLALAFFLPWFVGVRLPVVRRSLLRPDYLSGVGVIPVILLAYVFQGFYTNFIAGLYIREKTSRLPLVTGAGALVNVAANFALVPRFGILGAAYATLVAYVVMAGVLYAFAQRVFPIPYEWGRVAKIFAVVGIAYALGALAGPGLLQAAAVLAAAGGLFAVGFFERSELRAMRALLRGREAAPGAEPVEESVEREGGI